MPFWSLLLTWVVSFVITELLRPSPDLENAKPAALGDFQVPTATEGRAVPLIWGRVNLKGPNVVWFGDYRTKKITEKVQTGLFSSERVTIGYEYFIGLHMALCRGPLDGPDDRFGNVRNDDSFVWGPDSPAGQGRVSLSDSGTDINVIDRDFFGEDDKPGQGGLDLRWRIYPGTQTQSVDNYIANRTGRSIAYRGTVHVVQRNSWIGNSPNIRNFEFELERYPNGLGLSAGDRRVNRGANPMNVLYECLTNAEWGLGLDVTDVDVAGFQAIASTLATEGQGFAWIWDSAREVTEVIKLIEQQVDGILTQDATTGVFTFTLVRDDYTPGTLPLLDETNVISVERFKRPGWNTTANVVQLQFADRQAAFRTTYAQAQDSANIDITGAVNITDLRFPGVTDRGLANDICWRELRLLSYPIATGRLIVNRTQYDLKPGDVREFSWSQLGLTRLPIRVTRIDRGNLLKGQIAIDFSEDIFNASGGTFSPPPTSEWVQPSTDAAANLVERLFEIPYVLTDANDSGGNTVAVQVATINVAGSGQEIAYNQYISVADFPTVPADPGEGDPATPFRAEGFSPYGLLTAPLDKGQTNGFQDAVGFIVDNGVDLDSLVDINASQLENLQNACLIDDEIILFSDVTDNLNDTFTIFNLIRGALDTVPADHADNAQVFFFSYGSGLLNTLPETDTSQNWKARSQPLTSFSLFDFNLTNVISLTTQGRAGKAYPARNVRVNDGTPGGGYFPISAGSPSGANVVGDLAIRWNGSDKFNQARALPWDGAHQVQEPGSAFRVRVIEDPNGLGTVVLDQSGIPAGLTEGAYNAAGFADDTVTDEYLVDIRSENANGESQIWEFGPFTIYGYGYKYDEKYGGDSAGVIVYKGDPPVTTDPIPGVTAQTTITITASGGVSTSDALQVRVNFVRTGDLTSQNENYLIQGPGKVTPADYLVDLANQIAADFAAVDVQTDVTGNVLTITSSTGSIGGQVDITVAAVSISRIQVAQNTRPGDQIVHFDLYDGDTSVQPSAESVAPDAAAQYNGALPQENVLEFRIVGLTPAARKRVPRNGLDVRILWGGRSVAPGTQAVVRDIPLRSGTPDTPVVGFDSSLLGQLSRWQAENPELAKGVVWSRFAPVQPGGVATDRTGVEIWLRPNFEMQVGSTYDTTPVNTIYDGANGPLKLLGKSIAPARAQAEGAAALPNLDTLRVVFANYFDDFYGDAPLVIGQVYRIELDGTTYTETANAGDAADNQFRDGIYARLKTTIDAAAGGSTYLCTLNLEDRATGGTFVASMDIERLSGAFSSFSASASNALIIDVQQTIT